MALEVEKRVGKKESSEFFPLTEQSFRQIFNNYYPQMVSKANAILKDEALAKDAAQYVLMNLWRSKDTLQINRSLEAYLMTGTLNRSLSLLKSRRIHAGTSEVELINEKSKDDAQLIIEGKEMKKRIHDAIDALPEKCRRVFVLCRLEGLSHREIAARLGVSTKTIENQMTRALKELRAVLYAIKMFWLWWIL